MENLTRELSALQEKLTIIRRKLHQMPEIGHELKKTRSLVMEELKRIGCTPREMGGGIVAEIQGEKPGKTMLLRADMDALPLKEQTELSFRSQNGAMHACGHDMHTTMLLGAAELLMHRRNRLSGTVKLMFQPDEEGLTGAKSMVEAGLLENPAPHAALALHVHSGTKSGGVLCGVGVCMAGSRFFRIEVQGKGCHGAMPETGVDPIYIGNQIYTALQGLLTREKPQAEPVSMTFGKFCGGDAPNVIPESVTLEGTIRTPNRQLGEMLYRRVQEVSRQIAKAFHGHAVISEIASVPPHENDAKLVHELSSYLKEVPWISSVSFYEGSGLGADDFSVLSKSVPCVYLLLGAGDAAQGSPYGQPMHNEKVVFDESILSKGAGIYALCALRWLRDQS